MVTIISSLIITNWKWESKTPTIWEDRFNVYMNIYGIYLYDKYLKYQDVYVSF